MLTHSLLYSPAPHFLFTRSLSPPLQVEQYPGLADAYLRRYRDARPDVRTLTLGYTAELMAAMAPLRAQAGWVFRSRSRYGSGVLTLALGHTAELMAAVAPLRTQASWPELCLQLYPIHVSGPSSAIIQIRLVWWSLPWDGHPSLIYMCCYILLCLYCPPPFTLPAFLHPHLAPPSTPLPASPACHLPTDLPHSPPPSLPQSAGLRRCRAPDGPGGGRPRCSLPRRVYRMYRLYRLRNHHHHYLGVITVASGFGGCGRCLRAAEGQEARCEGSCSRGPHLGLQGMVCGWGDRSRDRR